MYRAGKKSRKSYIALAAILAVIVLITYKSIFGFFYPLEYFSIISRYANQYNLDPYLVSALIRVESRFDPGARSEKGAMGLMQVTGTTGRWAASKIGLDGYRDSMLFDPDVNVHIGCWYLNNLYKEFADERGKTDIILVLAAYNGGSGNVKKWLDNRAYSNTGSDLKQIPFKETRSYVEKVIINYRIYRWLYGS